jgi:hypothetical protein
MPDNHVTDKMPYFYFSFNIKQIMDGDPAGCKLSFMKLMAGL